MINYNKEYYFVQAATLPDQKYKHIRRDLLGCNENAMDDREKEYYFVSQRSHDTKV